MASVESNSRFRRDFLILWSGQLLSAVGNQLNALALVWIAVESGGEHAGWVVAAGAAGRLLFGLVGGAYADRVDRWKVMIGCDIACAVAVATLPLAGLGGGYPLAWLAAVAFVVGALDSFFQPALQASLPQIAPDAARLQSANAWLDVNRRLALALGPGATGLLLVVLPLEHFFTLNAVTFALSAYAVRALGSNRYRWRAERRARRRSLPHEIAEGLRDAWRHRLLRWGLGQIAVWNFAVGPALSVGAAMLVQRELGAGPEWFGYVLAAYGIGNVASNLVIGWLHVERIERLLFAGGLVAGLGWLAFALTPQPGPLLVVTAIAACGGPMGDLMLLRIIQGDFDPALVGRVFSVRMTVSRTFNALGLACAVPVYAWLGTRAAIGAGALALATYAGIAMWFRVIRYRPRRPVAGPPAVVS